ncbi:MAG: sugar transferase [Anaerolineae bacterium]|uniref:sugar transferase n=1 Tax=Promineifilum sp. TaxID=2664178 RepID=UPI001E02E953|nr:sugar transferase [Anaerolineales bacterium]MCB8934446.1 sugar transferase [Promineifilum sp.]MCO5182305.1 sugar transferase [Promineifilum sp.]MCW5848239.1 sugar transferase [Anaerolineae bacterium]
MFRAPATNTVNTLPTLNMGWMNRWLKLGLDYALTLPTLLLIAPLLMVIAALIKLDSPGPVFYRRRVVGRHGREFDAFKFRTMYIDGNDRLIADRESWMEVLQGCIDNDPRLTRVGRFLRRYGLDELPRLFNVLNRTMSLVGPRMMTRPELLKFGHRVNGYTSVLPGMTGLWQVSGHSRAVDDRVELESRYIRNWSILLDVQILIQSVVVAFTVHA